VKQIGGDHYEGLGVYQPLNVMASWFSLEEYHGFLKGNILKYLARKKDNELEDLEKALSYLQLLVESKRSACHEDNALARGGSDGGDVGQADSTGHGAGDPGMLLVCEQDVDSLPRRFVNRVRMLWRT
jgi:hypothetical protein